MMQKEEDNQNGVMGFRDLRRGIYCYFEHVSEAIHEMMKAKPAIF